MRLKQQMSSTKISSYQLVRFSSKVLNFRRR